MSNIQNTGGGTGGLTGNPAFRATLTSNQTGVTSATPTQVTNLSAVYDVGSHFSSNSWTPPAGKIAISGIGYMTGSITVGASAAAYIYKDGSPVAQHVFAAFTTNAAQADIFLEDTANGSNVYTFWVLGTTTTGTITVSAATGPMVTWFEGHMISL